jgi:hypothetical protein
MSFASFRSTVLVRCGHEEGSLSYPVWRCKVSWRKASSRRRTSFAFGELSTGILPPLRAGAFSAYLHRPAELRAELTEAGLEVAHLATVEGPRMIVADLDARMADPVDRAAILDAATALESVPELIGFGPHLLATAILPASG